MQGFLFPVLNWFMVTLLKCFLRAQIGRIRGDFREVLPMFTSRKKVRIWANLNNHKISLLRLNLIKFVGKIGISKSLIENESQYQISIWDKFNDASYIRSVINGLL